MTTVDEVEVAAKGQKLMTVESEAVDDSRRVKADWAVKTTRKFSFCLAAKVRLHPDVQVRSPSSTKSKQDKNADSDESGTAKVVLESV